MSARKARDMPEDIGADAPGSPGLLEKLFKLSERGSSVRTELVGGLTTFMTMGYIIFANAAILHDGAKMPLGAVMVATCLAAASGSILMGFLANLPVALAPGMGMNALVSYTICAGHGLSWQQALGLVFWSGVIFIILSAFKFREKIINAIPQGLKFGAAAGIGLFIAFIGLKNAGIVVDHPATLVALGDLSASHVLLAIFGLALTAGLFVARVRGAVLIGIVATGVAGLIFGVLPRGERPDLAFSEVFFGLSFFEGLKLATIPALLTLLFFDVFDTVGTLVGVCEEAGLVDEAGRIPNAGRALLSDAIGTSVGATLGTSTVTSYIESASGVASGARTGLSSVFVGGFFLLSLLVLPVVSVFGSPVVVGEGPGALKFYPVTAPALIIVGFLMVKAMRKVSWDDPTEALPAFLAMLVMPLTYSISAGLAVGFVAASLLKLVSGRGKELHWLVHAIAAVIVAGYVGIQIVK